jgi:hypothetical protein
MLHYKSTSTITFHFKYLYSQRKNYKKKLKDSGNNQRYLIYLL